MIAILWCSLVLGNAVTDGRGLFDGGVFDKDEPVDGGSPSHCTASKCCLFMDFHCSVFDLALGKCSIFPHPGHLAFTRRSEPEIQTPEQIPIRRYITVFSADGCHAPSFTFNLSH
uniref:HDC03059 n=1 Tax=Drosophila melanogaster TaxID=7227 RepID=Q6IH76_DROME|nr:TPA_inf: HDC03059 [Drosophila melanogaster]